MRIAVLFLTFLFCSLAHGQTLTRELPAAARPQISIENFGGKVRVTSVAGETIKISAASPKDAVVETDLNLKAADGAVNIIVNPSKRIDLTLEVPERARLKITGRDSAVEIGGNLESAQISTETGTIYAQVPTDALKVHFLWTERRPLLLSDLTLPEPKEKAGGKFVVEKKFGAEQKAKKSEDETADLDSTDEASETEETANEEKPKKKKPKNKTEKNLGNLISLDFKTERGVILLNVPPSEVPSDLRDRDLTRAAKAIIQSGDRVLTDAIRKVSPRRFGDYAKTLPAYRGEPTLLKNGRTNTVVNSDAARRLNISVTDKQGRAVNNLSKADFTVFEGAETREILDVQPTATPFNLVLLLDVSGSVEDHINFIRKAARNFINTVSPQDSLAVVTFGDDVQVLSNFSGNKRQLSDSLDTFDAGGGTALYDALAFTLVETLKPLRGERTAIVVLSDGDDNRSFIPFEPLLGTIQESGALVYPLYVPSGLIPSNRAANSDDTADPLRNRYLTLTTKAEEEARRLAEISGGVYFPIRRLEDLTQAYEDIVAQLRTAYTLTYQSKSSAAPRVAVKRENAFVRLGSSISVPPRLQSRKRESVNLAPLAAFQKISFSPAEFQDSNVTGEIKQIQYKPLAIATLREFALENLDVNRAPPAFVVNDAQKKLAVSRWVSPKRTRSYPYERLYNTLAHRKRAAVIPVLKDEGQSGERDFLAWDTVSLLNLLEVYVVLGYYDQAEKSPRREHSLVGQKFNSDFIRAKLKELTATNLSAFEWNLRELKNLKQIVQLAKTAYQKISETADVRMHDQNGVENFERKLTGDIREFLEFSRQKSVQAQRRELQTDQPKETMPTETKSRITIADYLGGKYFLTVDEAVYENSVLYLIESKHTERGKLTHTSDIKDGLIKMILYRNLTDVRRHGKLVKFVPVLRLTAKEMQGAINSAAKPEELAKFIETNRFDSKQIDLLKKLFAEARENNFLIKLEQATTK